MSGENTVAGAAPRRRPVREADVVYCYDGSWDGFLCCVFASFARRELPFAIWPPERETATLFPAVQIAADPAQARRVADGCLRLLGSEGWRLLTYGFLSGRADRELVLLRFLHVAFAEGPGALALLGHPAVAPVYDMARNVSRETEKWMGFVRFEESGGMLGAVLHPENHVLPLLRSHFCARFPEETFLLYDASHSEALLYRPHTAELLTLSAPLTLPPPSRQEAYWQALWKQFYATLAIPARRNEALRRNHCPKRYRADMTELRGEAPPRR